MKLLPIVMMALGIAVTGPSLAEEVNTGGLETVRGIETLDATKNAEAMKRVLKDKNPIARNYVHQPPLIPHQIRGYKVNLNSNKCLSCHGWKYARDAGATKVSLTHFENRDGRVLSDISPSRYFCSQCHVTQADAKPLVENTFEAVDSLTNEE